MSSWSESSCFRCLERSFFSIERRTQARAFPTSVLISLMFWMCLYTENRFRFRIKENCHCSSWFQNHQHKRKWEKTAPDDSDCSGYAHGIKCGISNWNTQTTTWGRQSVLVKFTSSNIFLNTPLMRRHGGMRHSGPRNGCFYTDFRPRATVYVITHGSGVRTRFLPLHLCHTAVCWELSAPTLLTSTPLNVSTYHVCSQTK